MQIEINLSKQDRGRILIIFTGAYFFAALAALCFAPLLPYIEEDMHLSKASLGLFTSLLYTGAMLAGFPAGLLSDKWGVPKTILAGLILHGLCTCIIPVLSSFYGMLFFVFIAGIGFGAVNPATSKGIVIWFETKWRATAMAIKQMGYTGGIMAAAAVLPAMAEIIGWRKSVMIVGGVVILCALLTFFIYPVSIIQKIKSQKKISKQIIIPIIKDKSVWKNKEILFWSFLCIFYAASQTCGTTYIAVFMVDNFFYSKIMAGLFLSITQGGGALGRIAWGRISDLYFSNKRENEIILIGFIAAIMCFLLGLLPNNTHACIIGIIAAIFGFTAFGFNVLFLTHMGEIAGPERAGQAIGVWVTLAYIGAVVPPPLFGFSIDKFGYKFSWIFLGIIMVMAALAGMIFTFKIRSKRKAVIENV